MATIDTLDIQIQADAQKANIAIDTLVNSLSRLSSALNASYGANLSSLSNGVSQLGLAMSTFKQNANAQTFNSLATSLNRINSIDTSNLGNLSTTITQLNNALGTLTNVGNNAKNIIELANALSNLGSKRIENATTNLPRLQVVLIDFINSLSRTPQVRESVIRLVQAIGQLSSAGNSVRNAGRTVANGLNQMTTASTRAKNAYKGLASTIGRFYATYFLAIRGIKKLSDAIQGSMDYVETYNYFSVTMDKIGKEYGDMYERFGYESAERYADSFTNRMNELTRKMTGYKVGDAGQLDLTDTVGLGLDPNQLMNFEAKVNAVTNSIGLIGETSVNTSKAVTMLSADLSSLTNTELTTVMTNLQSGLIGQSRALYKYGIDITNATLQTYAYGYGVEKAVSEMTQAEKMQLRLLAILDQSRVAWGDQANTINSVANQSRVLKQQFQNLSRTLGNLFLPIIQKALPVINGLVVALNRLFTAIGFSLWGDNWLKQLQDGISGGSVADDLGELGEEAEDTSKKVKKLNDNLQGFDEINKLHDDADDTGLGINPTDVIDLTEEIRKALENYESVWEKALKESGNKINGYADKFEKMLQPVKDVFTHLFNGEYFEAGQSVRQLATKILKFLTDAINSVNWKQLGTNIAQYWNGVFSEIKGEDIANGINAFTNALWDLISSFIKNFKWSQLFKIIGNTLANLDYATILKLVGLKLGLGLIKNFALGIKNNIKGAFTGAINGVNNVASGLGGLLGGKIVEGLKSPLMAIPAITAVALSSAISYYKDLASHYEHFAGEVSKETQDYIDEINQKIEDASQKLQDINLDFEGADDAAEAIGILADKYFALAEKTGKTSEEMAIMQSYKEELIRRNPEFEKILDDTTTSYEDQRDAINEIVDGLKNKALLEAGSKKLSETTDLFLDQKSNYDKAIDDLTEAKDKYLGLWDDFQYGQARIKRIFENRDSWHYDSSGFKVFKKEIKDELDDLLKQFGSTNLLQYLNENYSDLIKNSFDFGDFEEHYAKFIDDSTKNIGKQARDAQADYDTLKSKVKDLKDKLIELNIAMDYFAGIQAGAIPTTTSLYEYTDKKLEELKDNTSDYSKEIEAMFDETSDSLSKDLPEATKTAADSMEGMFSRLFSDNSPLAQSLATFFDNVSGDVSGLIYQIEHANPVFTIATAIGGDMLNLPYSTTNTLTNNANNVISNPYLPSSVINAQQQNGFTGASGYGVNVNVTLEGDAKDFFKANTSYSYQTGVSR